MTLKQEVINILDKYKFIYDANSSEKELIKFLKSRARVNWYCTVRFQKLSEDFIKEFKNILCWDCISYYQKLSENFIREFKNKVRWGYISIYQTLSEDFIREFKNKVRWDYISQYQTLSEDYIREFQYKVNWNYISQYQTLSEDFIREFQNEIDYVYISHSQIFSENFIREFKDKVNWTYISMYQTLSEDFIREFQNKVYWDYICQYQTLSENFIREFQDEVDWSYICEYQILSDEFRKEFNLRKPEDNWLYTSKEEKENFIKDNTDYEIKDNCIIAYKSVKNNFASVYKPGFQYEIGKTYTSSCNCNLNTHNSFGLAAWDKKNALKYYNKGKLLKVSIPIKKLGACIIDHKNKLRAFEMTVLEEVEF